MFHYENSETKQLGGGMKIIRRVSIRNGKGHKSITKYNKKKKISSIKKPIHKKHLNMIKKGKFVVGLFNDCIHCNKTKKHK
jgi:hypothetical protein